MTKLKDFILNEHNAAAHKTGERAAVLAIMCPVNRSLRITWCVNVDVFYGRAQYGTSADIEAPVFFWVENRLIAKKLVSQIEAHFDGFQDHDWIDTTPGEILAVLEREQSEFGVQMLTHDEYLKVLQGKDHSAAA